MTTRFRLGALATALALTFAAVVAVVLAPAPATAEPLPPETPDFTLKPGDVKTETYDQALVGSAEVKGKPDTCRHDQLTSMTCAAHRVKLTRAPGYTLRIVLEWAPAAGDSRAAHAPDVDMYVFDSPGGSFDSSEVGGAGQTMPEQSKIVPTQDEYDVVVQAYAGAINSHKLTLYYTNEAAPATGTNGPTPDIILTPKEPPFSKTYSTAMTGATGSPAFYPLVHYPPESCRSDPSFDGLCDVYRLKLNRNKTKGALNFVVITLEWDATTLPDLALVAAGLGLGTSPGLVMFLWDTPDHAMDRGAVGGQDDVLPQRMGFTATQDEYDLVVQVSKGAVSSYKISAVLSDEVFTKPYEILDPVTGQPLVQNPDGSLTPAQPVDNSVAVPSLAIAPIDTDSQIAGIGLGTTEQFDPADLISRGAIRATATTGTPPSGLVLFLALVLLPLLIVAAAVYTMRRRHADLF